MLWTLPPSLHYCPHATVKSLPSRQKELVAHCVCLVSEQIVASEGVDVCRWLSIFHLIPRLLLLSSLHKRINTPYTSKFRRTAGGRRIRAPCDLAGDAFETRVRAFLRGRFFELLTTSYDVANYPHLPPEQTHYSPDTPPPTRSLRSRALEVRDLVRLGELSRAVTRADAASLATPSPSTISALTHLHPEPYHSTDSPPVRTDIVSPPYTPQPTPCVTH